MAASALRLCKQLTSTRDGGLILITRCGRVERHGPERDVVPHLGFEFGFAGVVLARALGLCRRTVLLVIHGRGHAHVIDKGSGDLLTQVRLVGFPAKTANHGAVVHIVTHIVRSTIQALRFLCCS